MCIGPSVTDMRHRMGLSLIESRFELLVSLIPTSLRTTAR